MLNPRRTYGDAPNVGTSNRSIHQQLTKILGQSVRILRPDRVLFVDRNVVREELALGKEEAGNRLARDIDEARGPQSDGGLDHVERGHQVVLEDDVRGVMCRLGDGGSMD